MENVLHKPKLIKSFTKGNLLSRIVHHLIPLILANFLQLFFTTMDIFTVTKFGGGNISSGAIGATSNLINLILCIFWGITSGIGIVIGNAKGANDYEKVKRTIGTAVALMLIASVIVGVFGIISSKTLLKLMGTSDAFIEKSTTYLVIFFIGTPFNLLFNTGASFFRAMGDTKRPLIAISISGVINIGLNFLLVSKLDVAGVAIATIASQAISMVIIFLYLMFDKKTMGAFRFKFIKIYKNETFEILKHGITNGLQSFIFNFTNVYIQSCFNSLGDAAVIGKAASSNLEGYQYAILNGISQTCMVAVSQNYGAKNKERTMKSFLICILLELIVVTTFDTIMFAFNKPLLNLFINSSEATAVEATSIARISLIVLGLPYAICGIAECCTAYIRGMKKPFAPTIVSLCCIVGFRMFFILVLFKIEFFHNCTWLYLNYPISWILCCIVYIPVVLLEQRKAFEN